MPTRRIALTGGIACGKSLVGETLRAKGIPVIDADDVVHGMLRNDEDLKSNIRQAFGEMVFDATGGVDRPKLGQYVFSDAEKRKLVESWIHPKIREAMLAFFAEHDAQPFVVAIIPLFFESNLEPYYDEVWLLETDEATRLERLLQKRGMSQEEALARMKSQMPAEEKRRRAEQCDCYHILDNNGAPNALLQQVERILERV